MADLYKKLYDHRESLRDAENKHTPTAVIADAPLKSLARLAPTSTEDMLKVSGIGKAFVEKYGKGFLEIIQSEQKPVKLKIMRKEVRDTLKSLQARLTNVNRRNRLLYLPKAVKGRAIDLYRANAPEYLNSVCDALLSSCGKVVLCDEKSENYAEYNRLIRAASADMRESGSNMLYVGYPFAVGKCGTLNTFNVAAPLVLFPVKIENVGGKIILTADDSRDITYNKALILCFNKFNDKPSAALPNCVIDEIRKREFISDICSFYAESGIELNHTDRAKAAERLDGYFSYTEKTFPSYGVNKFDIAHTAVVGLFPMYSGEIQKDFDDLIDSGVMPPTLTDLLEGADEVEDFYGDSVELVDSEVPVDSEGNIDYISELNVSQERAIEKSESELAIVMQGPPGTGKSQTITSMISNAVNKGKNVLVVSQKRAALSVIYSRLGRLSRYALFVDDPKDKQAFYSRLKAMFDADEPAPFNSVAFKRAVDDVDGDLKNLGDVASALTDDIYGAPMLKIYAENIDNKFKAAEREGSALSVERAEFFRDCVPDALFDCGYDEIKVARDYLNDEGLLALYGQYYELAEAYDWLVDVKTGLSGADVAELVGELDKLLDLYAYGRLKLKFKKALKAFIRANFISYDRAIYKRFVKDPVELYNGIKAYDAYHDGKTATEQLDGCTKLYFGSLYNLYKATGDRLIDLNSELTEYCGYAYIDRFENEHRKELSSVANYGATVARICAAIDRKQKLTRDKTLNLLKTAFNTDIGSSKRRGEMMRAIDGKRRPSAAKFAEKFEFELFRGVRVFLMTPEAVSEILPLKNDLFDLLVFDEASQIYVERGIPAIARAKRLVIAGDHKQLRPSSLGDGRVTVDDEEENEAVLEEESLLDIARFKFPEVMLSYHYRSRYEELIAFSDAAFYGGKLNISPNPVKPQSPPIKVHKVNGKWEDRVNTAEAVKTLELIKEHLASGSSDTLGVITFNAKQRDCILDMIDKKCDEDNEFKARYIEECARKEDGEDVGLFVKNIENVQGDERDRIIFSFAYAHNQKGVMSRNFGWLNRPGGENRLNVAISRAKKKIDIVTSIIPSDLKVDDIKSRGVHILRDYLDYAYCISDGDAEAARRLLSSYVGNDDIKTSTPTAASFKDLVEDELISRGFDVERDVGMGNYKIDLAVKNAKGDYALGIECVDSALKSSLSTRERDVMRKKFLESRGWSLYRVWISDWYEDPEKVIKSMPLPDTVRAA